jgi:hypothetical protein
VKRTTKSLSFISYNSAAIENERTRKLRRKGKRMESEAQFCVI